MKRTLTFTIFYCLLTIILLVGVAVSAGVSVEPVTEKFQIKLWNGQYYCQGKFPDTSTFELKSTEDLTYTQWKAKIVKAWADSQEPPEMPILYECDDYAIRDPNDGDLVLEWNDVRLTVTKKNLPALVDSTNRMNNLFKAML